MSSISIQNLGEVGRQVQALGSAAASATNSALLKGSKVIAAEASVRAPRTAKHRTGKKISPKHLADSLTAQGVTGRKVAGVTVQGGFNGPSYYVKFVEYGTTKQSAQRFIQQSAEAKEVEVLETVASELKDKLGL